MRVDLNASNSSRSSCSDYLWRNGRVELYKFMRLHPAALPGEPAYVERHEIGNGRIDCLELRLDLEGARHRRDGWLQIGLRNVGQFSQAVQERLNGNIP